MMNFLPACVPALRLRVACSQAKHARMLAASDAPPSTEEIAQFNIILFSSIALVIICYFSMMAMVNMVRGTCSSTLRLCLVSPFFPRGCMRAERVVNRSTLPPCACFASQDVGSDSLLYSKSKSD